MSKVSHFRLVLIGRKKETKGKREGGKERKGKERKEKKRKEKGREGGKEVRDIRREGK